MKNVDVEIYINQFINFFNNNPNDLIELIGDVLKEDFYEKVKQKSYENLKNGVDILVATPGRLLGQFSLN